MKRLLITDMPVKKENVFGRPNIGVSLALSNQYFIYPPKINPNIIEFAHTIHPDLISMETFIGGASVVGALVAMNSNGIVVPST
ncbi:MAG: hypothetical protein E4G98_02385, partial [Promethearchaeota archaeon]